MGEHDCKFEADIATMKAELTENSRLTREMHVGIVGTANGKTTGLNPRVSALEGWRKSTSTRSKTIAHWIFGIIGSVTASIVTAVVIAKIIGSAAAAAAGG